MTPDEYIKNAIRTNAPTDKAQERFNKLNHDDLKKLMSDYIEICNKLDAVKKAVFYGKNYQAAEAGQDADLVGKMNEKNMNIFHGVIGIATESGEMFEALLKFMNGEELDITNIGEECFDSDWYKSLLLHTLQLTMEDGWKKNIAKLRARYPDKFTEEKAVNRNLEVERKILES